MATADIAEISKLPEIIACARAAHEANRAYCIALGDESQVSWDDAPVWMRTSIINGVVGVLYGDTPDESHKRWMAEKFATGWKLGPKKDAATKEHPNLIPYAELPMAQRRKDYLFGDVVRAMADALMYTMRSDLVVR